MSTLTLFTHIQKTAGTSFRHQVIDATFKEGEVLDDFSPRQFKSCLEPQHKIAVGHFGYGLHHFTRRKTQYVTFLRDPVDRAVSHYFFIRQCDPRFCRHDRYEDATNMSIREFYSMPDYQNEMTAMIAGIAWMQAKRLIKGRRFDNLMLQAATLNLLRKYRCYGMQDKYDISVNLFKYAMGWKSKPLKQRHKLTKSRLALRDLDSETRSFLQRANHLDIQLYDAATKVFMERVERMNAMHLQ